MSHKRLREATLSKNLSVASKCLAIVLVSKTRKNSQDDLCNHECDNTIVDTTDGIVIVQSSEVQKALSPNGCNGKELLQDFKLRNKMCYWNPSLVESIKSLEYKGFVEPSTILVSGADIHIENIRSAWGRRVLKAPAGFIIERIGDVNGIQMQVIPQTQFMPLPDVLCSITMELNVQRVVATLDVILDKLSVWYRDMTLPDHQVIVDTLGSLIKDRKVFHTGSGYFVVTPDTNRLPNGTNNSTYMPTNASWLPYHPMYVPVFQGQAGPPLPPSRSHMRSISCQVTTIEETEESEGEDVREKAKPRNKESTLTRASRPHSMRKNKEAKVTQKDKGGVKAGKRDAESGEATKPNTAADKQKGDKVKEKTSLLSKIFGRNKKKAALQPPASTLMPPPPPPPPIPPHPVPIPAVRPQTAHSMTSKSVESQEKEYATFSAQFPPPEWAWYQQQLEKQKRTESWVTHQTTKAPTQTVSTVTRRPPLGSRTQGSSDQQHTHVRKSLMPLNSHPVEYLAMNPSHDPGVQRTTSQHDGEFVKPIRPDNFYESFRNPSTTSKHRHRYSHRKSRDFDQLGEENTKPSSHHKHHLHHHNPRHHHNTYPAKKTSDYDVIDQADITPINASNVYHSVSALSPVAGHFSDESTIYAKLTERPNMGPLHSTPRYSANGQGYNERMAIKVEGHEERDRIYGPSDLTNRRKSHRSKRRAQRAYGFCGNGDDISYEYKGRLPNKNSSRVQSRDSGVNCMGLGVNNNAGKKGGPLYENTGASNKYVNNNKAENENKASEQMRPIDTHVHFDDNNLTCATESISFDPYASTASVQYQSEITDPAFNSVVYGSSPCTGHLADNETGPIGSSVMYHTIAGSALEPSELTSPQASLAFYDDNSIANPAGKVITIQNEITQGDMEEFIDVEGGTTPDIREVAGSSNGMLEIAAEEDTTKIEGFDSQGIDVEEKVDDEDVPVLEIANREGDGKSTQCVDDRSNNVVNRVEIVEQLHSLPSVRPRNVIADIAVADSGFSSPRNPDASHPDPRGQLSGQSQSSEHSSSIHGDVQTTTESSDGHHNSEENTGSEGHQTHSDDVNMVSSEHHSGSANENVDLHSEDSSVGKRSHHQKANHRHSSYVTKACNGDGDHQLHPQHRQSVHISLPATAKILTHPDVFNNNATNILYSDQERPVQMPGLHANMNKRLNDQGPVNRDRHGMCHTASQLHMFEEEQLAKKYGGDFEVMGVL